MYDVLLCEYKFVCALMVKYVFRTSTSLTSIKLISNAYRVTIHRDLK